jgi:hypothetical protein
MASGENTQGGDSSKLQGNLNFTFDQRESEVNLHKATSSPESPSNVSPADSLISLFMYSEHPDHSNYVGQVYFITITSQATCCFHIYQ